MPIKSKKTTTTRKETKVIVKRLNLNTSNVLNNEPISEMDQLLTNRMTRIEYDNATDWEYGLEHLYSEEQIISINNILSYELNKRRGFGRCNDEDCYREERESDKESILYEEAMYGLYLLENDPELRKYFKYLSK